MKKIYMLIISIIIILLIIELIAYIYINNRYRQEDIAANNIIKRKNKFELKTIEEGKDIPKNILQTYKNTKIPAFVKKNIMKLNPKWKYHFYDDQMVKDFLLKEYGEHVLKKFNSFSKGPHKADLFRLCWLYKYGGVYIDIDVEFFESLDNLILNDMSNELFTMPLTKDRYGRIRLLNCFIITNKGNPLIKKCIEKILEIKNNDLDDCYLLMLLTMQHVLNKDINYHFFEKNSRGSNLLLLNGDNWYIYNSKEKIIANTRYENYYDNFFH